MYLRTLSAFGGYSCHNQSDGIGAKCVYALSLVSACVGPVAGLCPSVSPSQGTDWDRSAGNGLANSLFFFFFSSLLLILNDVDFLERINELPDIWCLSQPLPRPAFLHELQSLITPDEQGDPALRPDAPLAVSDKCRHCDCVRAADVTCRALDSSVGVVTGQRGE